MKFNKLLLDHRVLERLQLSRDQVNCSYKYINWVDESHSYTFEEESNLSPDPDVVKTRLFCRRS